MNELLTKIAHHLIADEPKDCGEQFLAGRAYGIAEMLSEIGRQSVAAKAPVGDSDLSKQLREALQKAFAFGQTYWAQSDSESVAQHKKSKETARKFHSFVDETCANITAWKDAQLARERQGNSMPVGWMVGLELFRTKAEAERNVRNPDLKPRPLIFGDSPQAQGEPVALEPKCEVCKDTGIVYTGPIGDPPEQCDACFDQEPAPQADEGNVK